MPANENLNYPFFEEIRTSISLINDTINNLLEISRLQRERIERLEQWKLECEESKSH